MRLSAQGAFAKFAVIAEQLGQQPFVTQNGCDYSGRLCQDFISLTPPEYGKSMDDQFFRIWHDYDDSDAQGRGAPMAGQQ